MKEFNGDNLRTLKTWVSGQNKKKVLGKVIKGVRHIRKNGIKSNKQVRMSDISDRSLSTSSSSMNSVQPCSPIVRHRLRAKKNKEVECYQTQNYINLDFNEKSSNSRSPYAVRAKIYKIADLQTATIIDLDNTQDLKAHSTKTIENANQSRQTRKGNLPDCCHAVISSSIGSYIAYETGKSNSSYSQDHKEDGTNVVDNNRDELDFCPVNEPECVAINDRNKITEDNCDEETSEVALNGRNKILQPSVQQHENNLYIEHKNKTPPASPVPNNHELLLNSNGSLPGLDKTETPTDQFYAAASTGEATSLCNSFAIGLAKEICNKDVPMIQLKVKVKTLKPSTQLKNIEISCKTMDKEQHVDETFAEEKIRTFSVTDNNKKERMPNDTERTQTVSLEKSNFIVNHADELSPAEISCSTVQGMIKQFSQMASKCQHEMGTLRRRCSLQDDQLISVRKLMKQFSENENRPITENSSFVHEMVKQFNQIGTECQRRNKTVRRYSSSGEDKLIRATEILRHFSENELSSVSRNCSFVHEMIKQFNQLSTQGQHKTNTVKKCCSLEDDQLISVRDRIKQFSECADQHNLTGTIKTSNKTTDGRDGNLKTLVIGKESAAETSEGNLRDHLGEEIDSNASHIVTPTAIGKIRHYLFTVKKAFEKEKNDMKDMFTLVGDYLRSDLTCEYLDELVEHMLDNSREGDKFSRQKYVRLLKEYQNYNSTCSNLKTYNKEVLPDIPFDEDVDVYSYNYDSYFEKIERYMTKYPGVDCSLQSSDREDDTSDFLSVDIEAYEQNCKTLNQDQEKCNSLCSEPIGNTTQELDKNKSTSNYEINKCNALQKSTDNYSNSSKGKEANLKDSSVGIQSNEHIYNYIDLKDDEKCVNCSDGINDATFSVETQQIDLARDQNKSCNHYEEVDETQEYFTGLDDTNMFHNNSMSSNLDRGIKEKFVLNLYESRASKRWKSSKIKCNANTLTILDNSAKSKDNESKLSNHYNLPVDFENSTSKILSSTAFDGNHCSDIMPEELYSQINFAKKTHSALDNEEQMEKTSQQMSDNTYLVPTKCEEEFTQNQRMSKPETFFELKRQADIEATTINQASKALEICKSSKEFSSSAQIVEAERILLIATCKYDLLKHQIQKSEYEPVEIHEPNSMGTIVVNNLHIPLLMKKADMNYRQYFLCTLSIEGKLLATKAVEADYNQNSVSFDEDIIIFDDLPPDFVIVLNVYNLKLEKPRKKKLRGVLRFNKKVKKLCSRKKLFNKDIQTVTLMQTLVSKSSFLLCGTLQFTLKDLCKGNVWQIKTMEETPLTDVIDFDATIIKVKTSLRKHGFLTVGTEINGHLEWNRRWCVLDDTFLKFYNYPGDEERIGPVFTLNLYSLTGKIRITDREHCARSKTLCLGTVELSLNEDADCSQVSSLVEYFLNADTYHDMYDWEMRINSVINSLTLWHELKPLSVTKC